MEITKENRKWLDDMGLSHPIVIAGPCSAETEDQVLKTAHLLKDTDANVFRAGIWKPRTRPGGFEGVGEIGLPWLQKVKEETGMLVTTEVGNAQHVELALKYDIDILWIGARTTVNPFAVQEIADALQNTNKIVLIKNPVNPDLALWVGAFERLQGSGIKKLGAIHRGFSNAQETKYRNSPMWAMAVELKRLFPQMPLIGDPSHMAGKRALLMELSQRILDLNYDGMIIETHRDPDAAWSDASQQVTPEKLGEMLRDLEVRNANYGADFSDELASLREKIDNIDREILEVLAARMSVVEKLGEYKRDNNVAVLQLDRWKQLHNDRANQAKGLALYPEFVEELFKLVHLESIRKQTEVMNNAAV